MQIKTGFLVAYDYEMLRISLPCIYHSSDVICLCIDVNRLTWAGNKFEINDDFFTWIKSFDTEKKILIYEDEFYVKSLSAKEMETLQRQKLADFLGRDGWHIQLDVDEYFVNFSEFVNELKKISTFSTAVYVKWKTIFKETENGLFFIKDIQRIPIATNDPDYKVCRITKNKNKKYLNFIMLHQSWGRSVEDVYMKFKNWGHKDDFDTDSYFEFWKSITIYNYKYIHDFQPLNPGAWASLEYVDGKDIQDILKKMATEKIPNERIIFFRKIIQLITPPLFNYIRLRLKRFL